MPRILSSLILIVFILSGCTGDKCIDADDFGYPRFTISSRYTPSELSQQYQGNQVAPWVDSNFTVNGNPLMIVVKTWEYQTDDNSSSELSAWCPWYSGASNTATLSEFCLRLAECQFINSVMCPNNSSSGDAPINNAPCLLKNGVGLYGLIADPSNDPNLSFNSQRSPQGLTFHVGDPFTKFQLFDINKMGETRPAGGILYNYDNTSTSTAATKLEYADSKLYFKILDKYYDDNGGQYRVAIKSGINDSRSDPIQFLTNLVITNLFGTTGDDYGIIRNIYLNITSNTAYKLSVKAILALYIMFTAFSFLIGNLNLTHTELMVRIVKVSAVSVLLSSEYSWDFFNDYLFVYFIGGASEVLQIINQAGQVSSGSSSLIALMIAPQTIAKLFSLLLVDWLGFIYIILFLVALFFLFMMIFEATIIYLTALIAIGIIIILAPIFLCFMLFKITRSLFENWLKQLISYAIQPMILFTGLAFISIIVEAEIYASLGFKVCKHDFPNLGPTAELFGDVAELTADALGLDISMINSIFYSWFPMPMKGENFTRTKAIIPVPKSFIQSDGTLCEAYGCLEERYIELPYLDLVDDADRINNFFNGNFVQLDGLLLIFAAVYLLSKFNDTSVSVANFLASTSGNMNSIGSIGRSAFAPIAAQMNKPIAMLKEQIGKGRSAITSKIPNAYENTMNKSLRKDAIGKGANSAVLEEVKKNSGLDQNDTRANAVKDYRNALKNRLKELNPGMSDEELRAKAKELSNKKYSELGREFSEIRFRELANNASAAREFQDTYVQAYQTMSNRGIGLLGKNIAGLRTIQEINYRSDSIKKEKQETRQNTVETASSRVEEAVIGKTINYQDSRLRTYSEIVTDERVGLQNSALRTEISRESAKARNDVLGPEYLARLEKGGNIAEAERLGALGRMKLRSDVRRALTDGNDPALMGETFMGTKATDAQLKNMIDRVYETEEKLLQQDRYLRREEKYQIIQEKSLEDIKSKSELLSTYYGRQDIKPDEMVGLLKDYYAASPSIDPKQAAHETEKLAKSLIDFDFGKTVLEKLEERKSQINKEIEAAIEKINKKRVEARMSECKKRRDQQPENNDKISEQRKLRSINDYLKK